MTNDLELPQIVFRDEWDKARKELLAKEKEATKARDALNTQRRELPMVKIEKDYTFEESNGKVSLLALFEGRRQLIVYHFMFDPDWDEGCSGCSFQADSIGHLAHLHARDTSLVLVSRAPLPKLEAYKARMGWTVPWYSSYGSDFNYDFHVTVDPEHGSTEYNYQDVRDLGESWEGWTGETPGTSVFLRDGENIFHTCSSYARAGELRMGGLMYLDLTPLGRQEYWEKPAGRGADSKPGAWWRRHDQYEV